MDNYKIKVNDEAESKEAQELFFELGASWRNSDSKTPIINSSLDYPLIVVVDNGYLYLTTNLYEKKEELTLPQLRDLVAQSKSKSIEFLEPQDDGTYKLINWTCMSCPPESFIEVPDEAELYVYWPHDKDYHFQSGQGFYEDGGWNLCSFSVEEIKRGEAGAEILWSREPIEQGLISGADAKLAWANGEALQIRETGTTEWHPLTDTYTLMVFDYDRYEIRKKPRTIKLELEIPAPFEPKDGEEAWCLDGNTLNGYKKVICDDFIDSGIGYWPTEEEIKQVVAALRGGIKG